MRMMPEVRKSALQARDTTLDNEKYDVQCSEVAWDMTSVLVTVLGDRPEAFVLDLGDDESRYLLLRHGPC